MVPRQGQVVVFVGGGVGAQLQAGAGFAEDVAAVLAAERAG